MSARRRSRRWCERVLQTTPYAEARAQALAGRGAGDLRIRHDLTRTGIPDELVQQAVDGLEPEADRARSVVSRRGTGRRPLAICTEKGFPRTSSRAPLQVGARRS